MSSKRGRDREPDDAKNASKTPVPGPAAPGLTRRDPVVTARTKVGANQLGATQPGGGRHADPLAAQKPGRFLNLARYRQNKAVDKKAVTQVTQRLEKKGFQPTPPAGLSGNTGNDLMMYKNNGAKHHYRVMEVKGSGNRVPPPSVVKTAYATDRLPNGMRQGSLPYAVHNLRRQARESQSADARRVALEALARRKMGTGSISAATYRVNTASGQMRIDRERQGNLRSPVTPSGQKRSQPTPPIGSRASKPTTTPSPSIASPRSSKK